jgi:hypothetical protein
VNNRIVSRIKILFVIILASVFGIILEELMPIIFNLITFTIMIPAIVFGIIMSVKQNKREFEQGVYHNGTYFTFGMAVGLGAGLSFELSIGSYPIIGQDIVGVGYLIIFMVCSLTGLLIGSLKKKSN